MPDHLSRLVVDVDKPQEELCPIEQVALSLLFCSQNPNLMKNWKLQNLPWLHNHHLSPFHYSLLCHYLQMTKMEHQILA